VERERHGHLTARGEQVGHRMGIRRSSHDAE
jgi:hypothetical protein